MKEIKTVMERLKKEYDSLEQENITATQSISEKQNDINTLTDEINALQAEIETRKENMAKLQQKIAETEAFERSIDEVVPLMREDGEEKGPEADYLAAVESAMDDAKIEEPTPFTFRNNLDVFNNTSDEAEQTDEADKAVATEVEGGEPMEEARPEEDEVSAMSFMRTPTDEDLTATPDYTMNEMYNGAAQEMGNETPAMEGETHFVPDNNGMTAMASINDVYNPLDSQEIDSPILR